MVARRWYVVRVQSGRENTVQTALTRRLKVAGKQEVVPRVLVPVETITEVKAGKKRTRKRKLYPGYVLVEVDEEKGKVPRDIWFLVRETTGVGDFVGPHGKPEPLDESEVARLLSDMERGEDKSPHVAISMKKGDSVKIKEGPLESFEGEVDEVIPAKGTVRVIVTIFGRATPVELEYWQVESI
ncbi:MAG: transcription termination/antitermination protein NusG [Planctomycetota bacterium]